MLRFVNWMICFLMEFFWRYCHCSFTISWCIFPDAKVIGNVLVRLVITRFWVSIILIKMHLVCSSPCGDKIFSSVLIVSPFHVFLFTILLFLLVCCMCPLSSGILWWMYHCVFFCIKFGNVFKKFLLIALISQRLTGDWIDWCTYLMWYTSVGVVLTLLLWVVSFFCW